MEGGRRGKGGVEGGGRRGEGSGGRKEGRGEWREEGGEEGGVRGEGSTGRRKRGRSSTTDLDHHIKCMFPPLSQFKHYSNKAMLVIH